MSTSPHSKPRTGAPYDLAGRRLVFTSYYHVKTGSFGWYNELGQNVSVHGNEGPWGAHFRGFDIPRGVRLAVQPAERVGPIAQPDAQGSARVLQIGSLLQDGERFRAWGQCCTAQGDKLPCYLETTDGWNWTEPVHCIIEGEGSTSLFAPGMGTVFIDPSSPPEERYKGVMEAYIVQDEFEVYLKTRPDDWERRAMREDMDRVVAIRGGVSADGIHWRILPVPIVVEHSDTQIVAEYDQVLGKYVMYTRNYMIGPRSAHIPDATYTHWWESARRSIGRSVSDNFSAFPLSQMILHPPASMPPSDLIYSNCKTTIPGAPEHHVMFPAIWHMHDDTTSIVLASSYDNEHWDFVPGAPVLETSPFGRWDGGCVFTSPNLVELPGGDWVLPYTGYSFPHKYPRGQLDYAPGYAVWRKGRLVGLEAEGYGEFATVARFPAGRTLRLNAVTRRAGSIKVEVAHADGTPIAGRTFDEAAPVIGDQYYRLLTWAGNSDLGYAEGEPIVLRFRLNQACLFGLEFE
ncbi:MAG: hypothetical protein ACYCZF_16175 [Anaerolineae bacterium]